MGATTFTRALGPAGVMPAGDTFDGTYNQYRVVRGLLNFSTSYATGGDTFPLATIGLTQIHRLLVDDDISPSIGGLSVSLVSTNPAVPLLQCFDANLTEVTNATNLSTRAGIGVWLLGY